MLTEHQMCKRDGLFEPIETVDYIMLNEETFDWDLWIEQELRRRYDTLEPCLAIIITC